MRKNKKGSYLVEAAMTMPFFLLAVIMLMSSVPVLSTVENAVFSIADEMRLESLKSAIRQNQYILPVKIKGRVCLENEDIDQFSILSYQYLDLDEGIEDLISVGFRITCQGRDPLGIFDQVSFHGNITARAFTGTLHKYAPDGVSVDEGIVYVFPYWGMRYHDQNCTYVRESCQLVYLSEETKKDYHSCNICNAASAQIGSPVFCFTRYGEAYHLEDCRIVERYFIEMEKGKAVSQGYTPCTKCGG